MATDVLLACSDDGTARTLIDIIEGEGYAYTRTSSLSEVAAAYRDNYPDVVVFTGKPQAIRESARRIRKDPLGNKPVLLALTSQACTKESLTEFLEAGIDDCLSRVEDLPKGIAWGLWHARSRQHSLHVDGKRDPHRYRYFFERSRDGFVITTPEGQIIEANAAARRMFGYSEDDIMTLNVRDVYVHPERRRELEEQLADRKSVNDFEVRLQRRDGKELICALSTTAQYDDKGELTAYHTVICDMTEERRLQEELMRLQEDRHEDVGYYLHEELASRLSGIAMLASMLTKDEIEESSSALDQQLAEITKLAREGADETRAVAREMRPTKIDEEGLRFALNSLVARKQREDATAITLSIDDDLPALDLKTASQVYWIAEEGLRRARGEGSRSVEITLASRPKDLVLTITSNKPSGVEGVAENDTSLASNLMQYRTRLLGGTLDVTERSPALQSVEIQFPRQQLEQLTANQRD